MAKQPKKQCHWISNTHWDREWRYSMQRTRYNLVYMMDMLLDIFEKEPKFKHFHLDSQTLPVQDYLEIRPEKEEKIKELVTNGKLAVGPWFCLPDEYCVGGESLVRNLLLGHKIGRKFGKVPKTGYSPFGWGQVSQMPQIYKGFGIDVMSFYRGINTIVAPNSEIQWVGPDGSKIIVSRLAPRPRYNVWYIVQRPAYGWKTNCGEREISWSEVGGAFRMMDEKSVSLDAQFLHPKHEYHKETIAASAKQAIEEQDGHWTTPHRFWSSGHDSSVPDLREVMMMADCNEALGDEADVFHSTIEDWQKGVIENARKDWPVVKGEMHHPANVGSSSELIGWIISARTYIKQANFNTERALTGYAEPLSVFASLLGAPYPQSFIDNAYNWLLQNHGHDDIAGCSRDVVHDDMIFRYRQSREISSCVAERAMMDITGSIDLSHKDANEMAVVVYNSLPYKRTETMHVVIDIPHRWGCSDFKIVNEKGKELPVQKLERKDTVYPIYFNNNDVVTRVNSTRYKATVEFPDVPGMGYNTFYVEPRFVDKFTPCTPPTTMLTGPQTMENEFLAVTINANGTMDVKDKTSKKIYSSLGYFKDSSETGDPWVHLPVEKETVYTTLNENARVTLVTDGDLEASFQVEIDWALPESSTLDNKKRSSVLKPFKICNTVTLRKGQPWVEVVTDVDNQSENHYFQTCFPSGIKSDKVMVQGQFDVVERQIKFKDYSLYYEYPQPENPMNSFVDISDGENGVALLNDGLKAYTAHTDEQRTLSISLLRCFPIKLCAMDERTDYTATDNGGQCLGKNSFRYAFMPHKGDWEKGGVWQASERFNFDFIPAQTSPTKHGTEPRTKSFLELQPDGLNVSAIKRSEDGKGWVIRLFNPSDKTVKGKIRFNGGNSGPGKVQSPTERVQKEFALPNSKGKAWKKVEEVTLEELPVKGLKTNAQSWVDVSITKKKIMTIKFQ